MKAVSEVLGPLGSLAHLESSIKSKLVAHLGCHPAITDARTTYQIARKLQLIASAQEAHSSPQPCYRGAVAGVASFCLPARS